MGIHHSVYFELTQASGSAGERISFERLDALESTPVVFVEIVEGSGEPT